MTTSTPDSGAAVFVHISDLHFRAAGTALAEREAHMRDLLLEDIPRIVALAHGRIEGVLLTGDIARAGQANEYTEARTWLNRLCDILGISRTMTFTVPGNHDINWDELTPWHRNMNRVLRTCPAHLIDEKIDELLGYPDMLLAPLENYQEFAAGYACDVEACLAWEAPPIKLGRGYTLRIRGANSVINSDGDDAEGTMAVQLNQLVAARTAGEVRLLMMHHSTHFWRRPNPTPAECGHQIVLYGHTHEAGHHLDGVSCLEVTAGAIHPEEREEFAIPGYNVVEISVEELDVAKDQVFARVRVFHRDFSKTHRTFGKLPSDPSIDERLPIVAAAEIGTEEDGREVVTTTEPREGAQDVGSEVAPNVESQPPFESAPGIPDPSRLVRLGFESLGAGDRLRLLDRIGVLRGELKGLPPHRQIRRFAEIIAERSLLDQYKQAIADLAGDATRTEGTSDGFEVR